MGTNQHVSTLIFGVLCGVGFLSSCRDEKPSRPESTASYDAKEDRTTSPVSAASPLEAARLLHALHEQREYGKIAQLIVDERRASTLRVLIALDEAIAANADLRRTAETAYSGPQSEYWDLASMENNLGIFSKKVSFINVAYRGDEAVVTFQQGDFVPLVHEDFVQQDGLWRLRPDHTPEQLPASLNELARVIREVEGEVAKGASLNAYVDSFVYRVVPQMRRVATAGDTKSPAMTARTTDVE